MSATDCPRCGRIAWLQAGVLLHGNGSPDCASLEAPDNSEVDR